MATEIATINVNFDIYNTESVKRLQEEDPDILPTYTVAESKDLAYNKKQINNAVTSAIIQGKSIDKIANDLQSRMESLNKNSAVKAARTGITNAQNAGTLSRMKELAAMGVDIQKEWVATLDDRTRKSHRKLDGERRDLDERFSNGLMYPGASGSSKEVWNCRCRMVSYLPDVDTSDAVRWSRDPNTGKREYVPNQTYEEWYKSKTTKSTKTIKQTGTLNDLGIGEIEYEYDPATGNLVLKGKDLWGSTWEGTFDISSGTYKYSEESGYKVEKALDVDEYNGWIVDIGNAPKLTKESVKSTKDAAKQSTAKKTTKTSSSTKLRRNKNKTELKTWENEYRSYNSKISFTEKSFPKSYIYTTNAYSRINGYLRGIKKLRGQDKTDMDYTVSEISTEMKKTSLAEDMICWRGVGNIDYITGTGNSYEDAVNSIGKLYTEKAFTSTTVVEGGGFSGIRLEIEVPKDTICIYCEDFSCYKGCGENELLLDCGTTFEVVGVEGNASTFTMKLKIVSQKNK